MLACLGVTLPGEGTRRLVRFTIGESRAGELRLPEGVVVIRRRGWLEVRAGEAVQAADRARTATPRTVPVGKPFRWPGWQFSPRAEPSATSGDGLPPDWAAFPSESVIEVRRWEAGDRICTPAAPAGRRISRYLAECGVPRLDRHGWPVVLLDGDVVWVPGVCRGLAAPHRSGRSDLIWYRSEREFS
jgi:tRNA(Ile)-lysidine synthase